MWEDSHIRFVEKIFCTKVCDIAFNHTCFQSIKESIVIYQLCTGKVNDSCPFLHKVKGIRIESSFCVRCQWNVNSDIITVFKNLFEIRNTSYVVRNIPSCFNRNVWIVTIDLHTQTVSIIGNTCTNSTKPDNTKGLTSNLATSKLFLPCFNLFRNIVTTKCVNPSIGRNIVTC